MGKAASERVDYKEMTPVERYLEAVRLVRAGGECLLVYVDYRDELSDEQLDRVLEDHTLFNLLEDPDFDSWLIDAQWEGADYEMRNRVPEELCDLLEEDNALDDVRYELMELDRSTPEEDLLRNTPAVFLAAPLPREMPDGDWGDSLVAALRECGLEMADPDTDLGEVRFNGEAWNCEPELLWHGDVFEVVAAYDNARLAITDPFVWFGDRLNGAGCLVETRGTVEVDPRSVFRDGAYGYGADEVCGLCPQAFARTAELR